MPTSLMGALFPSSSFGERPVVILDGGMGTTLQAPPFELGLDSALWRYVQALQAHTTAFADLSFPLRARYS